MKSSTETLAVIAAEIRKWADEDIHEVGRDVLRRQAQDFASRVDAAAKRKEAEVDQWRRMALCEDERANVAERENGAR